jgi:hypothetical protein
VILGAVVADLNGEVVTVDDMGVALMVETMCIVVSVEPIGGRVSSLEMCPRQGLPTSSVKLIRSFADRMKLLFSDG